MESFLPSEIARLVLGYLEEQKCEDAYNVFLKTSNNLEECVKMKEEGRKFRTQVLGLSLIDILYEYSAIYSLVQERLKKVDPEALERLRHSGTLLDKITFLLNSTSSGQTMLFSISLPPGNSPQTSTVAHAHVRKRLRTCSSSDKRRELFKKNNRNQNDASTNEILNETNNKISNLETTTLSSLPGNTNQNITLQENLNENIKENEIVKTPKRKVHSNSKRQSRAGSVVPEEVEENLDLTALTKALLDNHELHEKIAANINKVISTPESGNNANITPDMSALQNPSLSETTSNVSNNNFTMELDNVIKKIVHETESDPLFENFLHDVVGPPIQEETSDEYEDKGISDTSTPCKSTPDTIKKQSHLRHKLRCSKPKRANSPITSSSEVNSPSKIDHQNAVAIEGIISMNSTEKQKAPVSSIDIANVTVENVTVANENVQNIPAEISANTASTITPGLPVTSVPAAVGSICQTLTIDTTTPTTANISNIDPKNILINQNRNVLMVGQPEMSQSSAYLITEPFTPVYQQPLMQDNRIIFFSNKPPSLGSQFVSVQPSYQLSQPTTVLTENDILTMPTVIMCEEPQSSTGYILPQTTYTTIPKPTKVKKVIDKTIKKIVPKVANPDNKQKNELHLNKTNELQINKTNELQLNKPTAETGKIKYSISIQAEPQEPNTKVEEPAPSTSENVARSVPFISLSSTKKDCKSENAVTPEKINDKVRLSLSSPRSSRSHIRALDFSTPPKESHSVRKANTSPKSARSKIVNKQIRSSLFKSPKNTKISPIKKSPQIKLKGDWNEDLIIDEKEPATEEKIDEKVDLTEDKKVNRPRRAATLKSKYTEKKLVINESASEENKIKSLKKKLGSWDQDLRVLVEPIATTSKNSKPPVRKRTRISQRNKDKNQNLNTSEKQALSIELELAKIEDKNDSDEIKSSTTIENVDKENTDQTDVNAKNKNTKRKRQNSKSKCSVKKTELNISDDNQSLIIETSKEENNSSELDKSADNNTVQNVDSTTGGLRNMKPRYYKKCNIVSSAKKMTVNVDDKAKPKTESQSQEKIEEVIQRTILSPSKMNANKRNLVEPSPKNFAQIEKNISNVPESENIHSLSHSNLNFYDLTNKITPDLSKPSCSNQITAKRNLIPVLETPMKSDSVILPITPRLFTPFSESPLTKLLDEKLKSVDLVPFLTPSFPMTPSFPVTPNLEGGDTHSSYASRPTDYSTSSSYYQPSDSEQNQRLEQVLIEEAIKIESSTLKPKNLQTSTPSKLVAEFSNNELLNFLQNENIGVKAKSQLEGSLEELNITENSDKIDIAQTSIVSSQSSSDSSLCTSSSYSSCDTSKDNESIEGEANTTIIQNTSFTRGQSKTPGKNKSTLDDNSETNKRQSKTPKKKKESDLTKNKTENSNKEPIQTKKSKRITRQNIPNEIVTTSKEESESTSINREIKSKVTGSHVLLLKELEEKRKRTITELRNDTNKPTKPIRKMRVKTAPKISPKNNVIITRARGKKNQSESTGNKEATTKKVLSIKNIVHAPEPIIPRKSNSPRKPSIESVAARLLKDKDNSKNKEVSKQNDLNTLKIEDKLKTIVSPNTTLDSVNTSIHQDNDLLISVTPDEEIPRLHISSDEEDNTDFNLTNALTTATQQNDPELLVKELKERGIHLIPKKIKNEKIENTKQNENNKPTVEGNTIQNQENTNLSEYKNDKIEIMSDIYLDKSKIIDISKIEFSNSIVTDVISGNMVKKSLSNEEKTCIDTEKVNDKPAKNISKQTVPEIDTTNTADVSEYDFHVKVINVDSQEFINITYNEENKTQKKIKDYNFDVLDRKISAKIYIDEFDCWEDKHFTVTPYVELLSISPKRKEQTDENKSENTSVKPLDILYNEMVDDSSADTIVSIQEDKTQTGDETISKITTQVNVPENLSKKENKEEKYTENTKLAQTNTANTENKQNTNDNKKVKSTEKESTKQKLNEKSLKQIKSPEQDTNKRKATENKKEKKTEHDKQIKPIDKKVKKSIETENKKDEKLENDNIQQIKSTKSNIDQKNKLNPESGADKVKKETSTETKTTLKKTISLEQYKNKSAKKKPDTCTVPSSTDNKPDQVNKEDTKTNVTDSEDLNDEEMLMTFALTGSEKDLIDSSSQELIPKKRKADNDETSKQNPEKRLKSNKKHALLRTLDVETFLTKVHGPSGKLA